MAPKRGRKDAESSGSQKAPKLIDGKLSKYNPKWQPEMFKEKMRDVKKLGDVILSERKTELEDFRHFGLVNCFERLGWMKTLTFNNDDRCEVYLTEIIEWMATLRKEVGDNPRWTTQLIGKVNKKEVVLSMETLITVVPFDSKPREQYITESESYILCKDVEGMGPMWETMITELFVVQFTHFSSKMKLKMWQLKLLPILIFKLYTWNVKPRHGDKNSVRNYDVRILFGVFVCEQVT